MMTATVGTGRPTLSIEELQGKRVYDIDSRDYASAEGVLSKRLRRSTLMTVWLCAAFGLNTVLLIVGLTVGIGSLNLIAAAVYGGIVVLSVRHSNRSQGNLGRQMLLEEIRRAQEKSGSIRLRTRLA